MIDRRLFLKILLSSYFYNTLAFSGGRRGTLLIGARNEHSSGENFLFIYDLDLKKEIKIPMEFKIHEVILNSQNKNEVSCVGQWLSGFCKVDINKKAITHNYKIPSSKEQFVGHGVYTPDGNIYATVAEYEDNNYGVPGKGKIYCLDKNLKKWGTFPSFGLEPHDLQLFGNTLVVFNASLANAQTDFSNLDSSIAFIDWKKQKLIKKIKSGNKNSSLAHFYALNPGEIFGVGGRVFKNSALSPNILKVKNNSLVAGLESCDGSSPFLSIKADRALNILAATMPGESKICFWDLKSGKNIKNHILKKPVMGLSLTLDNQFFVGNGDEGLVFIDTKKLQIKEKIAFKDISLEGAHSKIF